MPIKPCPPNCPVKAPHLHHSGLSALRQTTVEPPRDISLERQLKKMLDDARWAAVTAKTPVLFDDEWTTWGELAGNDRMMCSFDENGTLTGNMPF